MYCIFVCFFHHETSDLEMTESRAAQHLFASAVKTKDYLRESHQSTNTSLGNECYSKTGLLQWSRRVSVTKYKR